MKATCVSEDREYRLYEFGFLKYDRATKMYHIDPAGQEEFGTINVNVDKPLDRWGEICAVLEELEEYGFDRKVEAIEVDDHTCIFLRDKNGIRMNVDLTEWDMAEKHIFDQSDIRDLIDLPRNVYMNEVFLFVFDDNVDDEDGIFQWGIFYPAQP